VVLRKWRKVKDYIRPEQCRMVEGGNEQSVGAGPGRKVAGKKGPAAVGRGVWTSNCIEKWE